MGMFSREGKIPQSPKEALNPMQELIELERAVFNKGYQERLKNVRDNLLVDNKGNVALKGAIDGLSEQDWKQMGPSLEKRLKDFYAEIGVE